MDKPAFLSASDSGSRSGPDIGPMQQPDAQHDIAPGGASMADVLPSIAVHGGPPATTGGYTADSGQDAMPRPGSTDGCQKAPEGNRR